MESFCHISCLINFRGFEKKVPMYPRRAWTEWIQWEPTQGLRAAKENKGCCQLQSPGPILCDQDFLEPPLHQHLSSPRIQVPSSEPPTYVNS